MYTLFENGWIHSKPQASALLVRDGRIAALGEREELLTLCKGEKCVSQDLEGNTLLPAFLDGHSHLSQYAQSLQFADAASCRSFEELLETLKRFAKENSLAPGQWLCAMGYDPERLVQGRHPDRNMLDQLKGYPVLLTAASGHLGVMNSLALEKAGITAETPDPSGGRIGRNESGQLTGYLEENAFFKAAAAIPPLTMEQKLENLVKAQQIYASYGITTAQEGLMHPGDLELLEKADRENRLMLEVVGYADLREHDLFPWQTPDFGVEKGGNFRVGGYKLFLDGSPQGRTAWLTRPYTPKEGETPGYRGYPAYPTEQVRAYVELAHGENRQLLTHCNGDAAIDQLLSVYEEPCVTRDVIVHAQTIRVDQLPKVRTLHLIPSYFVAHVYRYGEIHLLQLGEQRAEKISPLASTQALGIPFTLHQDTPVMPPDMLHTLYCATCRKTEKGRLLGGEERISMEQALQAVTFHAAYQYFEERRKGSLRVGMDADLTIVSGNLLGDDPAASQEKQVLETWRAGKPIYQRASPSSSH